jgi:hypothetical protein
LSGLRVSGAQSSGTALQITNGDKASARPGRRSPEGGGGTASRLTLHRARVESVERHELREAERATGSEDQAVKVANQPIRSLYIELARINATELTGDGGLL